jgi:hypothetical protein
MSASNSTGYQNITGQNEGTGAAVELASSEGVSKNGNTWGD